MPRSPKERKLQSMGVAWFVSYAFYNYVDKSHDNWQRTNTVTMRKSFYASSIEHHAEWLRQVPSMRSASLSRNTIGLSAEEIKNMAKEILNQMPQFHNI
ncbi:MAG: hypothetical protein SOU51_00570 [Collinsella sp.]|nr:hypothetical protein [Collinsella sp.]